MIATRSIVGITAGVLVGTATLLPPRLHAKELHDGSCTGLSGAAFGLCNAYCEAQNCSVRLRPSCAELRKNFAKLTGSSVFPCDALSPSPTQTAKIIPTLTPTPTEMPTQTPTQIPTETATGSATPTETQTETPTATAQLCGNGQVDPGETCDPPGSPCSPGGLCSSDCSCRGLNPECQGAMCGTFIQCNPGTACAEPVCGTTAEGGGLCVDGQTPCDGLVDCAASTDCPGGALCFVNSCCGRPVCMPTSALCTAP